MANTNLWRFRDDALALVDVARFEVRARDGSIGTVTQTIRREGTSYLVVDSGAAMPLGRSLLVPAGLIETIDVEGGRVEVGADRDQIRNAPEHDTTRDLDERMRGTLERHYGGSRAGSNAGKGRSSSGRRSTSASSRRATRSSRSRDDGPTKAELYEEAKQLGIEGRSKLGKAELARAVARRRGRESSGSRSDAAKANPVEVQNFLEGVGYPTRKHQLVREAERHGATSEVRATLRRLPDKQFASPTEVSEAIGNLG